MSRARKLFRDTIVFTAGEVLSYELSFARNGILARALMKSDFGLFAVFGMLLSVLEVADGMSFGLLLIQPKVGDAGACKKPQK